MCDSSDNPTASEACNNADNVTESEVCDNTNNATTSEVSDNDDNATASEASGNAECSCLHHDATTEQDSYSDSENSDSGTDDESSDHQPIQVNQLIEEIRSHLYINKNKVSGSKTKANFTIPKEPKDVVKIPDSPAELEELYESILRSSSTEQGSAYSKDLDHDLVSKHLTMQGFACDITRKMGLHVPILRMSTKNYCTVMQMNDGGMDYANGLIWGGPRLWLIIPSDYNQKLEKLVMEMLKEAKAKDPAELYEEWQPNCHTPLMHKRLAIAPKQLREAGIPFEIVAQYPGDIVYVKHNTLHQVVDVDLNINENANVGNNLWLENAAKFNMCSCNHQGVRALDLRPYRDLLRKHWIKARRSTKNAPSGRGRRR